MAEEEEKDNKPYIVLNGETLAGIPKEIYKTADYNDLVKPWNEVDDAIRDGQVYNYVLPDPIDNKRILLQDGSAGAPSLAFHNDTDTGRYLIAAGNVGESINGSLVYDWNSTRLLSAIIIHHPNGTVAAPALAFSSETGTGRYLIGAGNPGEAIGGVAAYDWNATRLFSATLGVYLGTGTPVTSADWLSVLKSSNGIVRNSVKNSNAGASALAEWYAENNAGNILTMGVRGSGWSGSPFNAGDAYIACGSSTDLQIYTPTNSSIFFLTGNTWRGTWDSGGDLELFYDLKFKVTSSGSFVSEFTLPSITANRTVTIPDWSGTLVLNEDLAVQEGGILFGIVGGGPAKTNNSILYFEEATSALSVGGNYIWKSGTSFKGTLDHANTADRVYTFPDASGTIPFGTGAANRVAFWSATSALTSEAGFEYNATTNYLTVGGSIGVGGITPPQDFLVIVQSDSTNPLNDPPRIALYDAGQALDTKAWAFAMQGSDFIGLAMDDAFTTASGNEWVRVTRSGQAIQLVKLANAAYTLSAVAGTSTFNATNLDIDHQFRGVNANGLLLLDAGTDRISSTVSDASTTPIYDFIQSSTGDAAIRFAIGTTQSYAIGIDNSVSDNLVISGAASGSAVLGTGNLLSMTTGGITTMAGVIRGPDASVSAPNWSWSSETNSGRYFVTTGTFAEVTAGVARWAWNASGFSMGSGYAMGWSSNTNPTAAALETTLFRDAAYTIAQRSGANAQEFRVYNTFTSSTNHEFGKLEWVSNVFNVGTEKGSGGGTARAMAFLTDNTERMRLLADKPVLVMDEADADPSTTDLDASDSVAIYTKSNKLVFAYNLAGVINYLTIPLDGATTTWTQGTTAP